MARSLLGEMSFIKDSISNSNNYQLVKQFSKKTDIDFYFKRNERFKKSAKIADQNYATPKILGVFNVSPIFDSLNRFKIELKNHKLTPFIVYHDPENEDRLIVKIGIKRGGVLTFNIPEKRVISSSKTIFILWFLSVSLLSVAISIIFLKNQIRSIKGLSKAADKFGRGQDVEDFKPSGAKEIRSVGISFIKMKERIARQVSQRTDMLSGVSHDLRTPLTRMKLQLELMPQSDATKDLKSDITDMEKMISEYLEFAKGGKKENGQNVKISDFLDKIIKYYVKLDKKITNRITIPDNFELNIRKNSMKRALRNLIDNGFNYGTQVILSAFIEDNYLKITVEDDGPGVPAAELENIFKPFYRVDNSRNLDKISGNIANDNIGGGAGLGLSIVLDAVSFHGGRVRAEKSAFGGLKVIINLPI